MRNKLLVFLTLVLVLALTVTLFACNTTPSVQDGDKTFKVTFFNNYPLGGKTVVKVKSGENAVKPADPSREGYVFAGWYDDYDGGTEYDFAQAVTQTVDLYAHWTQTTNLVTFKYNNGEGDSVVSVALGGKVDKPADPSREGYEFSGWFTTADFSVQYNFDAEVKSTTTLYAGWLRSAVRLTFNLNYNGAPDSVSVNVKVNEAVELPSSVTTERPLYAFDGWYTKAYPTDSDSAIDLSAGVEDDTVLYAKWTRTHYAVQFNPNVQGMDSKTVEVPVATHVAEVPSFERAGYTLDAKWYSDSALTTEYNLSDVKDDVVIYALWHINYYDVTFSLNYENATGAPATQSVAYQDNATRPSDNPERTGYVFMGWFTDATEGVDFNFAAMPITSSVALYAHWMEQQDVGGDITVTFVYNLSGRGNYDSVTIPKGEPVGDDRMPTDPTLGDDYMFIGWYTDAACKTEFSPFSVLMQDTTVYARILVMNIFEAEYVDLKDKTGVGSSVELPEEAMLFSYEKIGQGTNEGEEYVSNGWYVAGMYQKGMYIEFEITASRNIEDAVLAMRVSTEFKELHYGTADNPLTPETYRIDINPELDENGQVTDASNFLYEQKLVLPLPNTIKNADPDGEKTPFEDIIVSYHFHLKKGKNVIRFTTNNSWNYGDGTFQANAPMIDCIYIYTEEDVELTMTEYEEFLDKKSE